MIFETDLPALPAGKHKKGRASASWLAATELPKSQGLSSRKSIVVG